MHLCEPGMAAVWSGRPGSSPSRRRGRARGSWPESGTSPPPGSQKRSSSTGSQSCSKSFCAALVVGYRRSSGANLPGCGLDAAVGSATSSGSMFWNQIPALGPPTGVIQARTRASFRSSVSAKPGSAGSASSRAVEFRALAEGGQGQRLEAVVAVGDRRDHAAQQRLRRIAPASRVS